ncbi:MAG: hypothetical protein HZB16_11390 [Armatimonadetes bacterium]|nr:hypothetical protein [Armatimonadota bacterium]
MRKWWLAAGCAAALVGAAWAQAPAEEAVTLSFNAADAAQVATELTRLTGEPVLLDVDVEGKLTLQRQATKSTAVQTVAREALLTASRCIVFRPKAEGAKQPELAGDKRASLGYTDEVALATLAQDLEASTGLKVRCLPEVAQTKLKLTLAETDLRTVLDTVAVQAGCSWTQGWLLSRPNAEQALGMLRALSALPVDQRNRVLEAGLGQAMAGYHAMSPTDRQATVQRLVSRIGGYAQALAQADPATRAEVQQALKPLVEHGMGVFVRFDARDQAELMPVVRALGNLR